MPVATLPPPKRALADSTKAHRNVNLVKQSPNTAKRRKVDVGSSPSKRLKLSQNSLKNGSSQPKSQFEEEYLEKLTQDISGLKQQNSEKDQQWDRPSLDDFDEEKDSLRFQQIEAEEGTLHGGRTTVKLFGVTEVVMLSQFKSSANTERWQTGHSVLLHVTDFLHYLYVAAPVSFVKKDIDGFKAYLETQLAQHQPVIHSVQMSMRENLYGFQGNQKSPYLKITVTDPKHINKLRTTIESGNMNYKQMWKGVDGGILTFDSIQYVLRFMIDTGVSLSDVCMIPS